MSYTQGHAPLPPMRESSRFGAQLRRYLLPGSVLLLALLTWGAFHLVQTMELDLSIAPEMPILGHPTTSPAPASSMQDTTPPLQNTDPSAETQSETTESGTAASETAESETTSTEPTASPDS